jgi:hypothetical protein
VKANVSLVKKRKRDNSVSSVVEDKAKVVATSSGVQKEIRL